MRPSFVTLTCAVLSPIFVAATPALAQDLQFELINNSSITLTQLYASPVDEQAWGDDILGVDVLAPGETGTVTIAGGSANCQYDMRFVADNGNEVSGTADLCAMSSFTLND